MFQHSAKHPATPNRSTHRAWLALAATATCLWAQAALAACWDCPEEPSVNIAWASPTPASGATFAAPASFTMAATASSSYGITGVDFYVDGVPVGSDASSPYSFAVSGVAAGTHTIVAVANDNNGDSAQTGARNINVTAPPAAPTVTLTAPTPGASFTVNTPITVAASVANGSVTQVRFKQNGSVIGSDTTVAYGITYTPAATGSYTFVAEAMQSTTVVATSSPVTVNVVAAGGGGGPQVSVVRSFVYDANERLCKTIDPEAGATVMDYDAAGNIAWIATGTGLTSATCDRGSVTAAMKTTRSYDAMHQLRAVTTPDGVANATTTYTPDGLVASRTAANSWNGTYPVTTTYVYNKRRLLTSETASQPGWYAWPVTYGYNENGHLNHLFYPVGIYVPYAPDALGRPTQVGIFASGIEYHANGAIRQFTYGNGIVHTMTPNQRWLPGRSQDKYGSTAVLDDSYSYDANGNVRDIIDQAQGTARGMSYDGLDRLTTAVSSGTAAAPMWGTAQYTYDGIDNLRTSSLGAAAYAYGYDASNRLASLARSGGATYAYATDARGNVTSDGRQSYEWDSTNRLLAVTGKEYYRYDGLGRRALTWSSTDGRISLFMYSQAGQLLHVYDGIRSQHTSNIYLGNTLLATHAYLFAGGEAVRYQHTDGLGSPVVVTDANRNVVERTTYAPYGAPVNHPVEGVGYTGHAMDQTTGLVYMQQRYYDPQIGRFLSVDPVAPSTGDGSNFSRYAYANDNPFRFVDPDGRVGRLRGNRINVVAKDGNHVCERKGSECIEDYIKRKMKEAAADTRAYSENYGTAGPVKPFESLPATGEPKPDEHTDVPNSEKKNGYLGSDAKERIDRSKDSVWWRVIHDATIGKFADALTWVANKFEYSTPWQAQDDIDNADAAAIRHAQNEANQ